MIPVVSDYNSIDELVKEIEKGESTIVISRDIRKYSKPVTIVSGLKGRDDVKDITRQLKTRIGTGGTYKDGQIILQGNHRETVKNLLVEMGFAEESIEVY
jgi:translation initiation factor 1